MFKRIDHMEIIPQDLEKTLDFYTRILGFTIIERHPGRPGIKENVYLSLNDTKLEVIAAENPAPIMTGPPRVGYRMMAIEVNDMDKAIEFLKGQGVEINNPPRNIGPARRAEIKDPSGILIELRQW